MINKIKYFIQRGKSGYSTEDLWNFQNYLCSIIPPALRHLKENSTGCPGLLWDKEKVNDECHKWKEILEEVAQGFEAAKEIENSMGCQFKKELKNGAYTYEYDIERAKLLTQKFQKGMDLFKKYFFSLWD